VTTSSRCPPTIVNTPAAGSNKATRHPPAVGARLVRLALAATAALFARSIDRHLAEHDLKTSLAAPVGSKGSR